MIIANTEQHSALVEKIARRLAEDAGYDPDMPTHPCAPLDDCSTIDFHVVSSLHARVMLGASQLPYKSAAFIKIQVSTPLVNFLFLLWRFRLPPQDQALVGQKKVVKPVGLSEWVSAVWRLVERQAVNGACPHYPLLSGIANDDPHALCRA